MPRSRLSSPAKRRSVLTWLGALGALAFAIVAYTYLTLPDVRVLATENPKTTAFMELRTREAHAAGKTPRFAGTWVPRACRTRRRARS